MKPSLRLLFAVALTAGSSFAQSATPATPRAAEDASGEVTRWAVPPARIGKSSAEAGTGQKQALVASGGKPAGAKAAKPARIGKAGRGGKKAVPARRR